MSRQARFSKLCISALFVAACNTSFAESFQDSIFVNAAFGSGSLKGEEERFDIQQYELGAGIDLNDNLYVNGNYSYINFEGEYSHLLEGLAGYQRRVEPGLTVYGAAGGAYWNSSDIDETEIGYVIGLGAIWGQDKLRLKTGYKYYGGIEGDAIFDNAHVFSIGVVYNFGRLPSVQPHRWYEENKGLGNAGLDKTTACRDKHKNLFNFCDEMKVD